jgi:hypothetical protein
MTQQPTPADNRVITGQSKSQQVKTATEFFREKFADADESGSQSTTGGNQ